MESHRGPNEPNISLAARAGIGVRALQDWLNGERRPRDSNWEKAVQRWRATRHLVDPDAPIPQGPKGLHGKDTNSGRVGERVTGQSGVVEVRSQPVTGSAKTEATRQEGQRMVLSDKEQWILTTYRKTKDLHRTAALLDEVWRDKHFRAGPKARRNL